MLFVFIHIKQNAFRLVAKSVAGCGEPVLFWRLIYFLSVNRFFKRGCISAVNVSPWSAIA